MKKIIILFITILILLSGCFNDSGSIYLVTTNKNEDDLNYNQLAKRGLEFIEEIYDEWTTEYRQVRSEIYYQRVLKDAIDKGAKLIFSLDPVMGEYVNNIASENPAVNFAIFDWTPDSSDDFLENTAYILFRENEGSFLVGIVAGMVTESNLIGFIGDKKKLTTKLNEKGFIAGVEYINPDAYVMVENLDSFNDNEDAYEVSIKLFNDGADIIYHSTETAAEQIALACEEKGIWFIGSGRDQSCFAPQNTITNMLKLVDVAVNHISLDLILDYFPGGKITYFGIENIGVDYTKNFRINQAIKNEVADVIHKIKSGEIIVPDN